MAVLCGVDAGTTNTKAVAIDADSGRVLATAVEPTPRASAHGWDAYAIAASAHRVLGAVVAAAGTPAAVGIASTAESGVPVDSRLAPLSPMIVWHDQRARAEADALATRLGGAELAAITGQAIAAKYPLAKWAWLATHASHVLGAMAWWLSAADWIASTFTGSAVTDPTLAARTMAYDVTARRWHDTLAREAGVRTEQLPPTTAVAPARGAPVDGIDDGTPIVVTGHDHLVGAWGAGVRDTSIVADSLGTAEALIVLAPGDVDLTALAEHACTASPALVTNGNARYALVAGNSRAGGAIDDFCSTWLPDRVDDRYATFAALADGGAPASLVVEAWTSGRNAPSPDAHREAAVWGAVASTTVADVARGLVDTMAWHARWMTETLTAAAGTTAREVRLYGGGTRIPAAVVARAATNPQPTTTSTVSEAVAIGAASLAAHAAGLDHPPAPTTTPVHTDERIAADYQHGYCRYLAIAE